MKKVVVAGGLQTFANCAWAFSGRFSFCELLQTDFLAGFVF